MKIFEVLRGEGEFVGSLKATAGKEGNRKDRKYFHYASTKK